MAGMGTGTPIFFQCAACRRCKGASYDTDQYRAHVMKGRLGRVRLTGRSKPNPSRRRNQRCSDTSREYECLDCGHVGWSIHKDLERKYVATR